MKKLNLISPAIIFGILLFGWPDLLSGAVAKKKDIHLNLDFTQGGQRDESHDWKLGPTGARGWVYGSEAQTSEARQILVTAMAKGSPAEGKLLVGDVILGLGGREFSDDANIQFACANAKNT